MIYLQILKFITPKNIAITFSVIVLGFLLTKVYMLTIENNKLILELKDRVIEIDTLKNNTRELEAALDKQNQKFKELQTTTENKMKEYEDWKNHPEKYQSIRYITKVKEVDMNKTIEKKLNMIRNLKYKDI